MRAKLLTMLAIAAALVLAAPLAAQELPSPAQWDSLRADMVRARAWNRSAETTWSRLIERFDLMREQALAVPLPPELPPEDPPPPEPEPEAPAPSGALIELPAGVQAIIGPQVAPSANPWPWYEQNAVEHSDKLFAGNATGALDRANGYYYDTALVQYILHYRTGDPVALERARMAADHWYERSLIERERYGGYAPREAALSGLMLRALDGRPELWEFIARDARRHYDTWVGRRLDNAALHYGVRDGAYSLLFYAQLASVHPDPAQREAYRAAAHEAATRYYLRLQHPDGGWYWKDDGSDKAPGGVWEQPFMIGLLLEALIAVHQLTDDPAIASAITRSVDHLWASYRTDIVPDERGQGVGWRQVPYFVHTDGTWSGEKALSGGWDTNTIREGRQRNSLIVHGFGYAYQLTGDAKYLAWGDEIFAATYGRGEGPGADRFYGLADFRGKEFNQAYRSAGRYLAYRLTH